MSYLRSITIMWKILEYVYKKTFMEKDAGIVDAFAFLGRCFHSSAKSLPSVPSRQHGSALRSSPQAPAQNKATLAHAAHACSAHSGAPRKSKKTTKSPLGVLHIVAGHAKLNKN